MRWASRIGAIALIGGLAAAAGNTPFTPFTSRNVASDGELVINGGFENGKTGWRVNDTTTSTFAIGTPGHSGSAAATVLAQRTGTVALNDLKNTVAETKAATTYRVSAWLRSTTPGLLAQLRIREVQGTQLVWAAAQVAQLNSQWQQVSMNYRTATSGSKLDLNVVGWGIPAGYGIQIDDVSMRLANIPSPPVVTPTVTPPVSATAGPSPTPSATKTSVAVASPSKDAATGSASNGASVALNGRTVSNCLNSRGIPSCGAFIGAAIDGNADPSARESQFGSKLALRRTYYQATGVAKAVATAKSDVAAGRVPWISFKLPYSWTDMANGKGDAWAKNLAQQLSTVDGPVWVAFHHEPEGDGSMTEWTRMQRHLSPIVRSNASNVAFTIITTGWQQVFGSDPAYRLDALWPGDGLVDILGFDAYNNYGVTKNGKMITKFTEMKDYYTILSAFSKLHGTHWAIGETGYTDEAAAKDPAWLTRAQSDLEAMGGVGFAYFDSSLNSQGSWPLDSAEKVAAFRAALSNTIRIT